MNVTFSWEVVGANRVAIGIATPDALNQPYTDGLDRTGSITLPFSCGNASQTYTLTIADADGNHISRTLSVASGAAP